MPEPVGQRERLESLPGRVSKLPNYLLITLWAEHLATSGRAGCRRANCYRVQPRRCG